MKKDKKNRQNNKISELRNGCFYDYMVNFSNIAYAIKQYRDKATGYIPNKIKSSLK